MQLLLYYHMINIENQHALVQYICEVAPKKYEQQILVNVSCRNNEQIVKDIDLS